MGVIITGVMLVVLSIAFSLVLLDKLNISRQKIKKLEQTISEFRIIANKAEAKYREEAKRSREYEETTREALEVGREISKEYNTLVRRYKEAIKLMELMQLFNEEKL